MIEGIHPEKQRLTQIALRVHGALRMLKMGQTGVISLSPFKYEEVKNYIWAYAMHKRKWFTTRHDPNANVIIAQRAAPPPWDREDEFGGGRRGMNDLVERARNRNMPFGHLELIDKLANEVERLTEECKEWERSAGKATVLIKRLQVDEIERLQSEIKQWQAKVRELESRIA